AVVGGARRQVACGGTDVHIPAAPVEPRNVLPDLGPPTVCRTEPAQLEVTSPPTPRTHTPPPGWSNLGSPGDETKALPCWVRKAVRMLPRALANEPEAAPPVAAIAVN